MIFTNITFTPLDSQKTTPGFKIAKTFVEKTLIVTNIALIVTPLDSHKATRGFESAKTLFMEKTLIGGQKY